ncbi:MAG: hypothetical protein HFF09_02540, partial [Oscillospiraceae bacterium]|nr:hypothetical protein [Oscillospiraceae bacterium]
MDGKVTVDVKRAEAATAKLKTDINAVCGLVKRLNGAVAAAFDSKTMDELGRSAAKGFAVFEERVDEVGKKLSGLWEEQVRLMSSGMDALVASARQGLTAAMIPAVSMIQELASTAVSAAQQIQAVVRGFFHIQSNAADTANAIQAGVKEQKALTKATKKTGTAQKKVLAGFDTLNVLKAASGGSATASGQGAGQKGQAEPPLTDMVAGILAATGKLREALARLRGALAPFAEHVGEGLRWFYSNVMLPIGSWVCNEVLPRFLDVVTIALRGLNNVTEAAKPVFQWLWNNFLKPVGQWAGGVFVGALDVIIGLFEALVGILTGDFNMAMEGVSRAAEGLKAVWERMRDAVLAVVSAIQNTWIAFKGWMNETIIQPIAGFFSGLWSGISKRASEAWENIKGTVAGAWESLRATVSERASNLKENVGAAWNSLKTQTAEVWTNIRTAVTDAVDGMKSALAAPIEAIMGFLGKVIDMAVKAKDALVDFFKAGSSENQKMIIRNTP